MYYNIYYINNVHDIIKKLFFFFKLPLIPEKLVPVITPSVTWSDMFHVSALINFVFIVHNYIMIELIKHKKKGKYFILYSV